MNPFRMIGSNINSIINKKNITLKELSKKSNISELELNRFIYGRFLLSYSQLEKICDILVVKVKDILMENDDNSCVHCNGEFLDINNREKILDLIDDYMDIKDSLE